MSINQSICRFCRRLNRRSRLLCEAFGEDPIPSVIRSGEFDHRNPFRGDNGLQFAPKNEIAQARLGGDLEDE